MWKVSFGRQLNLTSKGRKTKRPTDHQVTANEGHYAGQFYTVYRWVFGIGYWVFCTAQRHCCSCSMCANLLMRLAHISICLMNCYRTHSFRVADLLLFIYSLRRVICRRLSFDLERCEHVWRAQTNLFWSFVLLRKHAWLVILWFYLAER